MQLDRLVLDLWMTGGCWTIKMTISFTVTVCNTRELELPTPFN